MRLLTAQKLPLLFRLPLAFEKANRVNAVFLQGEYSIF
jgi:hypothetical protein